MSVVGVGLTIMDQPKTIIASKTRIITHTELGSTSGMNVSRENLDARIPGKNGKIVGCVPGHGGDVYWVLHEGATLLAPYCWSEFELSSSEL